MGFAFTSITNVLEKKVLPESKDDNQILLTFDDGYENFYHYAAPVFEEEKVPVLMFAIAGRMGQANVWDKHLDPNCDRDRLMTQEQVKDLSQSDYISFGSHGLMHEKFSQLSAEALHEEIHGSYRSLSALLGDRFVPVMAYPWGDYDQRTLAAMAQSPYRYAFTTQKGRWHGGGNPFEVPRYSIFYRDGNPLIFRLKLWRNGIFR